MFLFKLNKNNKGYSAMNWGILLMTTLMLVCGILDLANLTVTKNVLINRVCFLSNAATIQGGLGDSAPYGWDEMYPGRSYISSSAAKGIFSNSFNYPFCSGASLSGTGSVAYQSEGTITGKVTYTPLFTRNMGMPSTNLKHSAKFAGFYIFRSTTV